MPVSRTATSSSTWCAIQHGAYVLSLLIGHDAKVDADTRAIDKWGQRICHEIRNFVTHRTSGNGQSDRERHALARHRNVVHHVEVND